jgi:signal transduction histidine kinase
VNLRAPLFLKYFAYCAALVCGAVLATGGISLYAAHQESRNASAKLLQEKALSAAARIGQFVQEIERQIGWTLLPGASQVAPAELRLEYLKLLRLVPAITDLSHVDRDGRERLRVSRLGMDSVGSGEDFSREAKFTQAKAGRPYLSPVYFRKETEPYMTIAVASTGRQVTVAEVNLKFIWDVVSGIKVGEKGHAYVVDSLGRLIAHPDISLVLQKTDLSVLSQVRSALDGREGSFSARDAGGQPVLTTFAAIAPPGWYVFVEQPEAEAFAPLHALILRTGLLLLAGLGLSVLASALIARRMVTPIRALQAGAAEIGKGALEHRIRVESGDELEALADQFNASAARLQESYSGLERKVEERTRALSETLEQQTAMSEVLRLITRSPTDVEPALAALAKRAASLCSAVHGHVLLVDGDVLRPLGGYAAEDGPIPLATERLPLERGYVTCRAVIDRAVIHIEDIVPLLDTEFRSARANQEKFGFRTVLVAPLMREDTAVGAIFLWRREVRRFSEAQVNLLKTFADQAAIAVDNVRLFNEIQEKSRQLEVANRHKSEFLATMSHELRTPLNAIIGFSEVLSERMFGELNPKQAEYLADIHASGRHLLSLINDILDLSKIEAGRMELDLARFSLPVVIDDALTLVRGRAAQHGVDLERDIDTRLGEFIGDELKFKQIVLNLLSNALKFTPQGGRVRVSAALLNGHAQVAVSDTGIGIAPADQETIFEAFRQAGVDHARAHEGTGLGLTLTRKFVELHGGRIWVDSLPAQGSTFTFTLPVRAWPVN